MPQIEQVPGVTGGCEPVVLVRREDAALRLFAFPHAGGNHTSFADWSSGLPDDVEIISYTLPGRGRLRDNAPYRKWQSMIDELADLVGGHDDGAPFVFFGHSFGALVAFDVCRQLAQENRRTPEMLFISAHRAPHLSSGQEKNSLPEGRFLELVKGWGLVPEELLEDEDLLQLVIPPLRADLKLDEEYCCQASDGRLSVPCVVYGGSEDRTVTAEGLRAWRQHFDDGTSFRMEILPGGHFYTISSRATLLDSISGHLGRVRAQVGPSVAAAGTSYPAPDRGVWARFQEHVASSPDALALADQSRRWSYRELSDSVIALGSDLAALGIAKGDVVGLLLPHSAEYCIGLLTCFGIGAPACLLEKNWPTSLLGRFLESAGVKTVVTTPDLVGLLPAPFQVPDKLVVPGRDRWTNPAGAAEPAVFPDVEPSDTAIISMTSGTSGTPKAVLNTHLGCLYCFDARYKLYPYRESSRDGLNVFFGWECLRPLLQGKSAVVIPDDHIFDPVRLVDTLQATRITRIVVPPSLFGAVLDHPAVGPELADRLGHMEIVFLMGEVVPARVVEKAAALLPAHVRLVNAYSTWESLDVSFADLLPRPTDKGTGSSSFAPAGRILDGSAAILLNDKGQPVPRGGVGELYFSSPGLAVGYLDDPVKTAERFMPCPAALADSPFAREVFYRTGDRARFLPDGDLEILGRIGDIVKMRGFKVSLRAVEKILEDQAGVSQVIVRPILDSATKQPASLAAYVLGDRGKPSDTVLARSRHKARRDLPEYARPKHFIGLDALPISQSDSRKLDLSALPAPPDDAREANVAADALTTMEQRIAQVWREVLGVQVVDTDDNFFDVGGESLSAARLSGLLAERFGISLPVVEVYQFSTLRDMAGHCSGRQASAELPVAPVRRGRQPETAKLAVVGMAGRFPGAPTIDAFWENLKNGTDSLTTFSTEQLRKKGVAEEVLAHPHWVPVGQLVDDADKFDAAFWGIGQREAVMMDPQHRVFIEVAWSALEQAGYARRNNPYRRRTGVFAASGMDGYLIHHLQGGALKEPLDPAGIFLTEIGNEKDYIATRVAYLMDLGGPAVTVTSACSSALVAVAQAAQSIMSGQCDMAIAGASSITFPNFGYLYEDGLVGSVDGHVRPFDAAASGTLFGDSVGAVVLKRLDDAVQDGDHIWAVLTGVGVSNDGRMKAGYTAPSARAQAQCISDAIAMAGIDSEQLSYVECHATATHIGDAIEIKGLLDAFTRHRGNGAARTASCRIGSVKGNIGHANCAAGITGLIKTVLCLYRRELVPTVNCETLNPKLVDLVDCDGSPFTVQEAYAGWTVADPRTQLPRRTGVSSFGIGGTNAHVILEEAPEAAREAPDPASLRSLHLVTVSARSETAFRRNAHALAQFIQGLPDEEIAPAIRFLHLSREPHALRGSAIVTQGSAAGLDDLRRLGERPPRAVLRPGHAVTVAFCFSGQGSQTPGMARGLYRGRADGGRFRRHFDAACESLARHLACDPAALILGADDTSVMRPLTTQCGLFAVEYALAKTLMEIGVKPVAVAGHSIGEYAAAVVSGLLTLEEAAALVAVRAQATEDLVPEGVSEEDGVGGMLSVAGDEDRLVGWLQDREELWLAAENTPGRTVLSGTATALRRAAAELPSLGLSCRPVPVSHPFHSDLMAPVAARLDAAASGLPARLPGVPMASNLTGSWFDSRYQPGAYWGEHMTSKVRWRDDVDMLLNWDPGIVLEIGPGDVLTTFTRKCLEHRAGTGGLPLVTMPHAKDPGQGDEAGLLEAIGQLWCHGVDLDFAAFHQGEPAAVGRSAPRRLLPTYSFDRTSYWTRPEASAYLGLETGATPAEGDIGSARQAPQRLVRFVEKPGARVKLYCFPYAGGNSSAVRSWAHAAPQWLDVVAVELPGRNGQAGSVTPADEHDDTTTLADLAADIRSDAGSTAVAFCGLSFGASVVLDLLGGPLADWARGGRVTAISVVGRAPITPGADPAQCPLDSYLMVPDEVRDDAQWRQAVLPLLEADLAFDGRSERRIIERQEHRGTRVIDSPLQVHCGTEDPSFPSAAAAGWAAVTENPIVEVHRHPGSHDFMLHHRERIMEQLVAFLDRLDPRDSDHDRRTSMLHEVRWVPVRASADLDPAKSIRWIDFDDAGRAASVKFLRDSLTGPESEAALVCRLSTEPTPGRSGEKLLELLKSVVHAEARGRVILVLPARDTSGLVTGMTRSLGHEEPGLTVQRVYVHKWPSREEESERIEQLLRAARSHLREADLLYRGGHLLALRLLPATLPELPRGTLGASGGSYLITGGTGGIGRVVTDWLIHNQAVEPARVVVSARTAPQDLRRGIRFLGMDFARPIDTGALAAQTGPLAGIIHLAGSIDDGVLRNLDASRFSAVLAPKLVLPRLSELGRQAGAAWIAVFSSTSALLGAPGQANYAAANAWADAYAMWSTPDGGPSVASVNWGTWGDVGMASRNPKALGAARASGETPLRTGAALILFGRVVAAMLSGSAAGQNFVACDVDWRRSPWADMPLVSELPEPGPQDRPRHPAPAADSGAAAYEGEDDGIRSFLSAYVHRWDESKRLAELGLDSLDFARMRGDFARRFGKDVPLATIAKPDQCLGELYSLLSEC